MEIKSNTIGKLQKIADLKVFTDILTFVKEVLQNCQRARAKNVFVTVEDGLFRISDDGTGCRPEALLTLDYSEWDSTKEGFGIGFWSVFAIPELEEIRISSRNWTAKLEPKKILENGDLSVQMDTQEYKKGFALTLCSPWFVEHKGEVEEEVEKIARYLPFQTFVNGMEVERSTILDDFQPDNGFAYTAKHRGYKVKLSPSYSYDSRVRIYYDGREIGQAYWASSNLDGVIDIAPGTVNMKEPDRMEMVHDPSFYAFREHFREDKKAAYKAWIKDKGVEDERYASCISDVLSVKDYERYLTLDPSLYQDIASEKQEDHETDEWAGKEPLIPPQVFFRTAMAVSTEREPDKKVTGHIRAKQKRSVRQPAESTEFRNGIKKLKKRSFWMRANEQEEYKDAAAEAEYAGLTVLTAKNELYENAFRERGLHHISELQQSMYKTTERKDCYPKTQKEKVFLSVLTPIAKAFGLPEDIFCMADLSEETEIILDGKRVYRRVMKNRSGEIKIYGMTDGNKIYLDRKAMDLKDYKLRPTNGHMGTWEYRALMNAVPVVAHELAHYLYKTTDNTVEHYQAIERLEHRISELYR